jgi:hypothetical protein
MFDIAFVEILQPMRAILRMARKMMTLRTECPNVLNEPNVYFMSDEC